MIGMLERTMMRDRRLRTIQMMMKAETNRASLRNLRRMWSMEADVWNGKTLWPMMMLLMRMMMRMMMRTTKLMTSCYCRCSSGGSGGCDGGCGRGGSCVYCWS